MSARPDSAQASAHEGHVGTTLPCLGSLSVNCNMNDDRDDYEYSQSNDVELVGDYESESETFFRVAFGDMEAIEAEASKKRKKTEGEPDGCPPATHDPTQRALLKDYKDTSFICLLRYVNTLPLNKDFLRFYQGIDPFDAQYNEKVCGVSADKSRRENFGEIDDLRRKWASFNVITNQQVLVKNAHWINPVTPDKSWKPPADWTKPLDLDAAREQLLVAIKKASTSTNDGRLEQLVKSSNTPKERKDLEGLIPNDIELPPAWITAAVPHAVTLDHKHNLYEKKFLGPTATEWDTQVDNKYQLFIEKTIKLAWLRYCGYYEQTTDQPATRVARGKKKAPGQARPKAADALNGGTDTPNEQAQAGSSSREVPLFAKQDACLTQAEVSEIELMLSYATNILSYRTPEQTKAEQARLEAIKQKESDDQEAAQKAREAKNNENTEKPTQQAAEEAPTEQAPTEEAPTEQAPTEKDPTQGPDSTQSTKPASPK